MVFDQLENPNIGWPRLLAQGALAPDWCLMNHEISCLPPPHTCCLHYQGLTCLLPAKTAMDSTTLRNHKTQIKSSFISLSLVMVSLHTNRRLRQARLAGWPASRRVPPIFTSHVPGLKACTIPPSFSLTDVGFGNQTCVFMFSGWALSQLYHPSSQPLLCFLNLKNAFNLGNLKFLSYFTGG